MRTTLLAKLQAVPISQFSTDVLLLLQDPTWHISRRIGTSLISLSLFLFFFFFCLFAFSRAVPMAYGGSQARGLIGTGATGIHQSHSTMGSEPLL